MLLVVAVLALLYVANTTRLASEGVDAIFRVIQQATHAMNDVITYTKALPDGTVLAATYHRKPGESDQEFAERAAAAWAAVKAANGC